MAVGTSLVVVCLGLLNGQIYGAHSDEAHRCFGPQCFFWTMLAASASALCACPIIVWVSIKYGRAKQ